jgi:ribosome-associated protein
VRDEAAELACLCARLADERKAEDILVLNVGPVASFTDYFVIATGRNERQIKAIADEVTHTIKHLHGPLLGTEGDARAGWVLIDLGDTIVHLFSPEARHLYDLELLWGEAQTVDWHVTPAPPLPPAPQP